MLQMSSTRLNNLPHGILGLLLAHPSISFASIKLWCTGDKNLQLRLERGITFVHLKNGVPQNRLLFPQVLLRFQSLRHLSIETPHTLVEHVESYAIIISRLPRCLEYLRLSTGDTCSPLTDYSTSSNMNVTGQSDLPILDMNSLFPSLQTLHIDFASNTLPSFHVTDFDKLPHSLTTLGGYLQLPDDIVVIETLPRSLRRIEGILNFGGCPSSDTL